MITSAVPAGSAFSTMARIKYDGKLVDAESVQRCWVEVTSGLTSTKDEYDLEIDEVFVPLINDCVWVKDRTGYNFRHDLDGDLGLGNGNVGVGVYYLAYWVTMELNVTFLAFVHRLTVREYDFTC